MTTTIRLQREAFDVAAETAPMTRGRTDIGAVVTFTGVCRADENGKPIAALTLEHYPGMAEAEIARHVEEANARWPLLGVTVIHRYGRHGARRSHRAGRDGFEPSRGGVCGGVFSDGLPENAGAVLEAGGNGRRDGLGSKPKLRMTRPRGAGRCRRLGMKPQSEASLFAQAQNVGDNFLNLVCQQIRVGHASRTIQASSRCGHEIFQRIGARVRSLRD